MPITPNSTIGKLACNRQRYFSSSNSAYNNSNTKQALNNMYSSGYNTYNQRVGSNSGIGGPVITTLSPASSNANLYMNEGKGVSNNWFSNSATSASSTMQRSSGFVPVAKNTSFNTSSMTNQGQQSLLRGNGRDEEEEELINVSYSPIDTDKQFRPIFQPNLNESVATSFTSAPGKTNMGSNSRRNYSASSYEYSTKNIKN